MYRLEHTLSDYEYGYETGLRLDHIRPDVVGIKSVLGLGTTVQSAHPQVVPNRGGVLSTCPPDWSSEKRMGG